jgi:hypothetical protein
MGKIEAENLSAAVKIAVSKIESKSCRAVGRVRYFRADTDRDAEVVGIVFEEFESTENYKKVG